MNPSFLWGVRVLLLWAAFAGPASAQAAAVSGARPAVSMPGPEMNQQEYLIGPHDLIEVTVFQVEDLSRTVRVNARGSFSLPLIGAVDAAGRTASDVEALISDKLRDCCLQDPQVTIFIKEFVSQRVTVEGEVAKPGVYALSGRTTLLQAIAMAAGAGQLAELNEVRIFRTLPDGLKEGLSYDLEAIRAGSQADPVIQGNDVVVVSKSGSLTAVKGITDTLRGFIGFGTVR